MAVKLTMVRTTTLVSDVVKLIVGLGNPGRKYENTRHNVGFEVIHLLARRYASGGGGWRSKFDGEILEIELAGERILLLMPQTFMNLSGRSVRQAIDFFKLSLQDVLVICDDFHLELGVLRFRPGGTDGGQKGLADITQSVASKQFSRLRIGIGLVPERWNPADFVLGKFTSDQRISLEKALVRATDGVVLWASDGVDKAMNQFNAKL